MPVKITYFVHATSTDNEKKLSSGWSDPGLSEAGVKQATELRETLNNWKFDIVFCSDLRRAVESARLAFVGLAPIVPDSRLQECNYGVFNALPSTIVEPMQENHLIVAFPGGESYADVTARLVDFLAYLQMNYEGKSVAIVSHKAPQLVLDVLLKGKTWEQAFAEDWRKRGVWQPGWEYILDLRRWVVLEKRNDVVSFWSPDNSLSPVGSKNLGVAGVTSVRSSPCPEMLRPSAEGLQHDN